MRLVKPSATLIAALALWVGAGVAAFAQATPPSPKQTPPTKSALSKQQGAPPAKAKAPAKAVAQKPVAKSSAKVSSSQKVVQLAPAKRDPFQPLISKAEPGRATAEEDLGPGPGGVRVSGVRLDGTVRAPNGMIAVISTPRQRVYFIREGTRLYDGVVEKIALDSITMRERGQDPFGKPLERQVIKRLYPRAGEQ